MFLSSKNSLGALKEHNFGHKAHGLEQCSSKRMKIKDRTSMHTPSLFSPHLTDIFQENSLTFYLFNYKNAFNIKK